MGELVVKDNALINASYHLDLVEQRLILLAIVTARQTGKGVNAKEALTIHADSYATQFGVHRNTAYQALRDACNNLFDRQFSYQGINEYGEVECFKSRWVSRVSYIEAAAKVRLIFAPDVVPLITRLEQEFTKYDLEQVSSLNSSYAVRLYELLIQWRSVGKAPTLELEDIRKRLGVPENQYTRLEAFKRRVLDLAVTQINTHTDITVSYEQHKAGRTITGFSFTFKNKTPPKAKEVKKIKEAPLDGVSPSSCDKVIARFNALSLEEQENVMTQVQSGMKGRALAQFNAALSAYKTHPSPALFEEYEAYFKKAL